MKTYRFFILILICLHIIANIHLALGDTKQAPKKLPKSGLLAVSSISGASNAVTGDLFGGEGDVIAPITGTIVRVSEEEWRFRVQNASEDRYSVNLDFLQYDVSGRRVKFSSYSYTLKPSQSDGEEVSAGIGSTKAELHLRSYRNLSQEQREREAKDAH